MFGHTFLRIDHADEKDNKLLSYAISYGAEVPPGENALRYVWKGLVSGYPGYFTAAPYYDKVIEYNDLEARDIWEYQLNLTHAEQVQLLRHIWELQKIKIDYYFFDENCSYRLLSLLDAIKPGLNSKLAFNTHAIPADTIRVLKQKNLLKAPLYRPSALTSLNTKLNQVGEPGKDWIYKLANAKAEPKDITGTEVQQALILESTYDYIQYQQRKSPQKSRQNAPLSLKLLSARSKLPKTPSPSVTEPPLPSSGHHSARVQLGIGQFEDRNYLNIHFKPAFHDLLDNSQGYIEGSKIDFMAINFRHYFDNNTLKLHSLKVIDIKAAAIRNQFFKPLSWSATAQWQRFEELSDPMRFQLDASGGVTYKINKSQFSLDALGGVRTPKALNGQLEFAAGLRATYLWPLSPSTSILAQAETWNYEEKNASDGHIIKLGANWKLEQNQAIRFNIQERALRDRTYQDLNINWSYYF